MKIWAVGIEGIRTEDATLCIDKETAKAYAEYGEKDYLKGGYGTPLSLIGCQAMRLVWQPYKGYNGAERLCVIGVFDLHRELNEDGWAPYETKYETSYWVYEDTVFESLEELLAS